jgi:signal transduction histidine kinase
MFNPVIPIFSGMVVALSLAFLLIMAWYDLRRKIYQYFALLLVFVVIWNTGHLVYQFASALFDFDPTWLIVISMVEQLGFIGTNIALYAFVTNLVGFDTAYFRTLIFLTLIVVFIINVFPIVNNPSANNIQNINQLTFFGVSIVTSYLLWRNRQKIVTRGLLLGSIIIILGQLFTFLNADNLVIQFALPISGVGVLWMSTALVAQELINPLKNRSLQLEYMHEISISLTSGAGTKTILNEITQQVAHWLKADASIIFLVREKTIYSVATHNLPTRYNTLIYPVNNGIVGQSIQEKKPIRLENYQREWRGAEDLPNARKLLGSVISVPLAFQEQVYGALLVILGKHRRSFTQQDEKLVEMLGRQAAVALFQSQTLNDQRELTQQLENALNQLSTVLESTQNPVLAIDRKLTIIFANRATSRLLSSPDSSVILGTKLTQWLQENQLMPQSLREIYQHIRFDGHYAYEFNFNNQDYLCQIAPLGTKRIEGWVIIVNDVSDIKELERMQSEMLRMTSHDLKNPLQAALANVDLLRDDLNDLTYQNTQHREDMEGFVANIERELMKMYRIISGILDVERVRIAKSHYEESSVTTIMSDAVDEIKHMAQEKGVKIQQYIAPNLPPLSCDRQQLQRAFVNLIENAIKFSDNDAMINIRVDHIVIPSQPSLLQIEIQDEGIGIPEDIQGHIFERFYRGAQPGAEHITGTGLGLSLVKAVVNAHNGNIRVVSQPSEGSTFYVTLPIQ